MIILSIRNRKFVEEQDKLDKKLQKMSNLLKTAQNIVDDVMGQDESEDLKDARQIAFADIELGEVIGEGSFGNVYKAKYHGKFYSRLPPLLSLFLSLTHIFLVFFNSTQVKPWL